MADLMSADGAMLEQVDDAGMHDGSAEDDVGYDAQMVCLIHLG